MKSEEKEFLTPQELVAIEVRAKQLISERLQDAKRLSEVMGYIDPSETDPHIHRCLQNLDKFCGGEKIATDAVKNALCHLQRRITVEAESAWMDDCMEEAEKELFP